MFSCTLEDEESSSGGQLSSCPPCSRITFHQFRLAHSGPINTCGSDPQTALTGLVAEQCVCVSETGSAQTSWCSVCYVNPSKGSTAITNTRSQHRGHLWPRRLGAARLIALTAAQESHRTHTDTHIRVFTHTKYSTAQYRFPSVCVSNHWLPLDKSKGFTLGDKSFSAGVWQ